MADSHDNIGMGPSPDPGSTSSTLLDRLRLGDAQAWNRMVNLYYQTVYAWCRPRVSGVEDAREVVQEVFAAVLRSLQSFQRDQQGATFRGWMRGIARHKLQDYWRRKAAPDLPAGGTDAARSLAEVPEPLSEELELPAGEKSRLVRSALEQIRHEFSEQMWQAFWRATVDGQLPADIAKDLHTTVNVVYKAKSRILARLREELGELLD
jgi:RNA polymerase sigma-70 factor (ECF subfamily)